MNRNNIILLITVMLLVGTFTLLYKTFTLKKE